MQPLLAPRLIVGTHPYTAFTAKAVGGVGKNPFPRGIFSPFYFSRIFIINLFVIYGSLPPLSPTLVHQLFSGRQTAITNFISDASQGWSADYDTGRGLPQPLYNSPTLPAAGSDHNHYEFEYSPISEGSPSVSVSFVSRDGVPLAPAAHVRNPLFINDRPVRLTSGDTKATAGFSQYGTVPSNNANVVQVVQEIDEGTKEVVMEIGDILQKETPI